MRYLDVILKGGLGNQLFQYYAGYELAQSQQRKLRLDTSWYRRDIHLNGLLDRRQFELNSYDFSHSSEIISNKRILNHPRSEEILGLLPRSVSLNLGYTTELKNFEISRAKTLVTSGYWLSQEFIPKVESARLQLIDGIRNPSPDYLYCYSQAKNFRPIAIHVRRGDYLRFPKIYGVTTVDYFRTALSVLSMKGREVWLFSDEPESAKEFLKPIVSVDRCMTSEYSLSAAETISVMSASGGIVASNSTFSWWAAHLSDAAKIVFPKDYLIGREVRSSGLYKADWNYL